MADQLNISVEGLEITFDGIQKVLDITVEDAAKVNINCGNGGEINLKAGSGGTVKLESGAGGTVLLKTDDSGMWKPCVVQTCIFSGAPHGGPPSITKLTGSG